MTMTYTVAILSDIHGNVAALDAVLADLTGQPHEETVVAGDLALLGPRPAESIARVREMNVPTIYGNSDQYIAKGNAPAIMTDWLPWVRERIGAEGVTYLAGLPFDHFIVPPDGKSPDSNLLIVHATPTDVDAALITEPNPGTLTITVTPEADAVRLIGDARADLIIYGHIHYASEGTVGKQRIASIGAVGFPFDGDPRAAYALVTWDGAHWHVTHRRVAYDYEAVARDAEASGAPFAAIAARRLREARA